MTGPAEKRKSQVYEIPNGSILGKYEILRKLATGGMAEIYLARARGTAGFEKLVVLKRILPNVAEDPTFVQMFLDEARLAASLQHPNIADVYDVGEDKGAYFFTMEFIHGQDTRSIRHALREKGEQIPLAIALSIVHGIASALDYAHGRTGPDGKKLGLVHRDVSSSNVLVSYDGAVKLVDFGIARATVSQHKTQTGTLKGKIPYMSPEQCKGLPLDNRSDLFSLGVLLYELTVGKRPFRGDSEFAIMDGIVYKGAQRPSEVVQGYPAGLEAIVMKLLERAPSQRYSSAEELIHDLDQFLTQNHLWVSAKQLGKYMRGVFADRMQAMEEAERAGVPFAQHVAKTITSQSQRSDILTPGSEFPGMPPRPSQEMLIAQELRTEAKRPSNPPPFVNIPTGETLVPAPTPVSVPIPDLRGSSSRRIVVALVAGLAIGGGGIGAYMYMQTGATPAAASATQPEKEDVRKMDVSPPDQPADNAKAPDKTVDKAPEKTVEKAPEKAPEKTIVKAPEKTIDKPPEKVATPEKTTPKSVRTPPHAPPPPPPPPKKTPKPPKSETTPDTKPDTKDQSWDPNSPLLPQ